MKIKLLLLSLFTPLLCGVSFGINLNQKTIDIINSVAFVSGSNLSSTAGYIDLYHVPSPSNNSYLNYCVLLSGFNISSSSSFVVRFNGDLSSSTSTPFYVSNLNYNLYCATGWRKYFQISFNSSTAYRLDNFWVFNANDILNQSSFYNCSSVESQLATCQSSLSDCQSNGSHCDTLYGVCVENLSGCKSDKISLQNYNDSLSSQLNECLSNSDGTGELLSGNCLQNSLFWLDNENMLSLPITNNLFLPNGYGGYLSTGNVLGISSLEDHSKVYEFDSGAKETTVNSIAYIMLFLIATGLIMVLLRFLKRLFKL